MLVVLQFDKENESTIMDVLDSVKLDFKLFCCGSLEVVAESLMEKCSNCKEKVTSEDAKDNEKMWILFILNKKNDKLMRSLLETCPVNVETFKDISKFFDSANVQCRICIGKSFRKRSLSIEGPVKTVDPTEEERIKKEPHDETVEKEKKPVNLGPRLVEIAVIKASGIVVKEEKDIKKEEDLDSPKTKRARIEMTVPEDVIKQEELDETLVRVYLKSDSNNAGYNRETSSNSLDEVYLFFGKEKNSDSKRKEPLECPHCGREFTTKQCLNRHLLTHTGELPFQCLECEKKFNLKSNLGKHVKAIHRVEKPHSCDICEMKFAMKGNLMTHKRTHDGSKPYSCDLCDKTFSRNGYLIIHKRTHTGEKPFHCDLCEKKFADRSSFNKHQMKHEGQNK